MIKPPANPEDDPRLRYLARIEADRAVDEEGQQHSSDPRRRLDQPSKLTRAVFGATWD